jgi:hypothetical protein
MMVDIPAQFGRAQLDVTFSAPGSAQAIGSVTLRLGRHVTVLPECIVSLLPSRQMAQVRALSSWYHDETNSLPYYLGVHFAAPEDGPRTRVEILFNLRTAKIIKIEGVVASESGEHHAGRDLSQRCTAQERDAVLDPAAALRAR